MITTDADTQDTAEKKSKRGRKRKIIESEATEQTEIVRKEDCEQCKDLAEGEFAEGHEFLHGALEDKPEEEKEEEFIEEEMSAELRDPRFSEFKVKKIVIGGGRELHIEIKKEFQKIYTHYLIEMVANLDVLDWRIEQKKKEKQNYEVQNQMDAFEDMKKRELEEYDRVIENLMTERADRVAQCPKISFNAEVKNYGKKPNSTNFIFWIPKEIVSELNDKIDFSDSYKIELIKNLNND